jgi:hypothetical protein
MSPESKKSGAAPQNETESRFKAVLAKLEHAREQAQARKEFATVRLVSVNGYALQVSITPDGTPALVLVSPNLRNRFVIANEEVINNVIRLLEAFKNDSDMKNAVFTFIAKYGRQPKTRGIVYEV